MNHNNKNSRLISMADYVTASLIGMIFLPCFILIMLFITQVNSELKWQLPLLAGGMVPFLCLRLLDTPSPAFKLAAVAVFGMAVLSALWLASLFYDPTWDSRSYHADAILQLLAGNNPFYEPMHGFYDRWTNHYPKITWYFASLMTHATGNYNLGKSYNLLLMYAVSGYVFSWLRSRGTPGFPAVLLAVAAAMNPVAISQLHSFYVDGALASLVTLAVFSSLAMLDDKTRRIDKIVFVTSSLLLINIKFTGLAYIIVFYAFTAAVMAGKWFGNRTPENFRQGKRLALSMGIILFIGVCCLGYNPYITNTLNHGNLFYPLAGAEKADIVAAQSPKSFNESGIGTLHKVILSVFSRTDNTLAKGGTAEPQWKIPFTFTTTELGWYYANDVRIGAWGVLFSGILLVALVFFIVSGSWRNIDNSVMILAVLVTILINPGSWWARYAPQVATLPVLFILPAFISDTHRQKKVPLLVGILLIVNSALIIPSNTRYFVDMTRQLQREIDNAIGHCGKGTYQISDVDGYHFEQFLHQNGIDITYPEEDIRKTHPAGELLPLLHVFLYKENCRF